MRLTPSPIPVTTLEDAHSVVEDLVDQIKVDILIHFVSLHTVCIDRVSYLHTLCINWSSNDVSLVH